MFKRFSFYCLVVSLFTCNIDCVFAQQLIDHERPVAYYRVFDETDNFDASYLDVLEEGYASLEVDTLRFAALNDLAYYTHTRNLKKSLDLPPVKAGLIL